MQMLRIALVVSVFAVGCESRDGSPHPPSKAEEVPGGSSSQPLKSFRPVVGGHLLATADGKSVAMADVEADRLRVYSLNPLGLAYDVALPEKSWPTRVVEGHHGEFHVLLRGAGAIATVVNRAMSVTFVCPEPRALAVASGSDELTVACAGGEVVRVLDGKVIGQNNTGVEWRDVALTAEGGLTGTSFRSAEVISLTDGHSVNSRMKVPEQRLDLTLGRNTLHQGQVAWRMVPAGPKTFLIHQLHAEKITVGGVDGGFSPNGPAPTGSNPYGGGAPTFPGEKPGCGNSAVVTAITTLENGAVTSVQRSADVLAVDAALSPDGSQLAVVGAGGTGLSIYPVSSLNSAFGPCLVATAGLTGLALNSVAWISPTRLVVIESLRAAPLMFDLSSGQSRSFGSEADRGSAAHALFHLAPRGGAPLACASCHPEGGEDGHTWVIDGKPRRTQTLAGGVMKRMPFHWQGDLSNLDSLMSDTFVKRMGGATLQFDQVSSLGDWLDTIPAPRPSRHLDEAQLLAGRTAFDKAQCSSCHFANGTQEGPATDIGTGESVRTPSLSGLSARAPYLHTGQIPDIRSRVTGGLHPQHGNLSRLNAAEKEQLIGYLESL